MNKPNPMQALVQRINDEEGLPAGTLTALAGIESSFNPKAVSQTGVKGLLQVTLATGKQYGLSTDADRLDPEKSARAGARYYKDLLKQYNGDPFMAAAHYNGGGREAMLYKAGRLGDMREETRNYVTKFRNAMGINPGPSIPSNYKLAGGDVAGGTNRVVDTEQAMRAQAAKEANEPGFIAGTIEAAKNSLTLNNMYVIGDELINGFGELDPDFRWTRERAAQYLTDLPERKHAYVLAATNEMEANRRRERVIRDVESEQKLATLGTGSVVAGSLLAALPDPTNLLPMAAAPKLGVLTNAALGATVLGGAEALGNASRSEADNSSVAIAAGIGAALGVVGKALTRSGVLSDIGNEIAEGGGEIANAAAARGSSNLPALRGEAGLPETVPLEGVLVEPAPALGFDAPRLERPVIDAEPGSWSTLQDTPLLPGPRSLEGPEVPPVLGGPEPVPDGPAGFLAGPPVPEAPLASAIKAAATPADSAPVSKGPKAAAGSRTLPELDIKDPTIPAAERSATGELNIPQGMTDTIAILKYVAKHTESLAQRVVSRSLYAFYKKNPKLLEIRTGDRSLGSGVLGNSTGTEGGAGLLRLANLSPASGVMLHEMMHGATNFIRTYATYVAAGGGLTRLTPGSFQAEAAKAVASYNLRMSQVLDELMKKAKDPVVRNYLEHVKKHSMNAGREYNRLAPRKGDEVAAYLLNPLDDAPGSAEAFALASQVMMPNSKKSALSAIGKALAKLLGFDTRGVSAVEAMLAAQADLAKANDVFLKETRRAIKAQSGVDMFKKMDNDQAIRRILKMEGVDLMTSPAVDVMAALANNADLATVLKAVPPDNVAVRSLFTRAWDYVKQFSSPSAAREAMLVTSQKSQGIRDLSRKLFHVTRGGIGVQGSTAADVQMKLFDGTYGKVAREFRTAFEEMMERDNIPLWREKEFYERVSREVAAHRFGITRSSDELVQRMSDALTRHYNEMVEHINNPGRTEGVDKLGLYNRTKVDAKGNPVLDAEGKPVKETVALEKDPNYHPIHHDSSKWDAVAAKYGQGVLEKFFAKAFAEAHVGVPADVAESFGKFYVATQLAAKNTTDLALDIRLERAGADELREKLRLAGNLTPQQIEALVEILETKGQIANKNLKARAKYSTSTKLRMEDGSELTLLDLADTRQLEVADMYTRRMSGTIALADRVGVYTDADIERAIEDATRADFGSGKSAGEVQADQKRLRDVFKLIQGTPMEEQTALTMTASVFRELAVAAFMPLAALNQLMETGKLVATMGVKSTLNGLIPALKEMRLVAKGKNEESWFRELYDFVGGPGDTLYTEHDLETFKGFRDIYGDTVSATLADRTAQLSKSLARQTMTKLGMVPLMRFQARLATTGLVNKWARAAATGKGWDYTPDRLATLGLTLEDQGVIMSRMKEFATLDKGGAVSNVNWKAWRTQDPASFGKFTTFVKRETRRMVQENDIGSSFPIMDTTFGKTMFQLWNFSMNAHSKQMMHAYNHQDAMLVQSLVGTVITTTLGTYAKVGLKSIGREDAEEYRDERLNFNAIVRSNLAMLPELGLLSSTVYPLLTGKDLQSERYEALSDTLFRPASLAVVDSIGAGARMLMPGEASKEDVQMLLRTVPGANLPGISGILRDMTSELPTRRQIDEQDELDF